jgi:hypothetical protein
MSLANQQISVGRITRLAASLNKDKMRKGSQGDFIGGEHCHRVDSQAVVIPCGVTSDDPRAPDCEVPG